MKPVRIILADDHAIIRDGLKSLIYQQSDMKIVAEAADGRAALAQIRSVKPDVIVLDISMQIMNGIQVIESIKRDSLPVRVVVLTAFSDTYLRPVLALGAAGYVLKQSGFEDLVKAIRTVHAGGTYIDPSVARNVVSGFVEQKKLRGSRHGDELSERETEVLREVGRGYSNKEIADRLLISVKTVETHKTNSMNKLGLQGRAQVVRFALDHGWLKES